MKPAKAAKEIVEQRPTEIASGLGVAAAITALLATNGVPGGVAVCIGVALGVVPLVISNTVDRLRK